MGVDRNETEGGGGFTNSLQLLEYGSGSKKVQSKIKNKIPKTLFIFIDLFKQYNTIHIEG